MVTTTLQNVLCVRYSVEEIAGPPNLLYGRGASDLRQLKKKCMWLGSNGQLLRRQNHVPHGMPLRLRLT